MTEKEFFERLKENKFIEDYEEHVKYRKEAVEYYYNRMDIPINTIINNRQYKKLNEAVNFKEFVKDPRNVIAAFDKLRKTKKLIFN